MATTPARSHRHAALIEGCKDIAFGSVSLTSACNYKLEYFTDALADRGNGIEGFRASL